MPILLSVLTIDGTPYDAAARTSGGFIVIPGSLERSLDGGYDTATFVELSQDPNPQFHEGMTFAWGIDIGDGGGSLPRFFGRITDKQSEFGGTGWRHAYTALGPKYLGDRVPITAVDGTGLQIYNRSPNDDYYVASDAGLELGEMIERLLTQVPTAQRLNALGIGNYTGLPSSPSLPASTLADLALLTVVPPRPVSWSGEGLFNQVDQEIAQWMPRFYSEIEPGGDIRFKDSLDTAVFVPRTVTLPGSGGLGDPVLPPRIRSSTQNCATRLVLRGGPIVEEATLSLLDGTLAEVFTSTDKTNWNLTYFTAPKGAYDRGDVTAVTSTSATLESDDPAFTTTTNYWSNNEAVVTLIDPVISGVDQMESRRVTSSTAMSAGNPADVTWDATWPITGTAYSRYTIVGGSGGLVDTWRTYTPREPNTGDTGLSTYIGSHLVVRSPHIVRVANAAGTVGQYYTTAMIQGGSLGQFMPLPVAPVPSEGIFRFFQPTVTVFGSPAFLNTGSPTTTAQGKPIDVIIYAFYSRGPLSVTVPPDVSGVPQYEGTAYTDFGVDETAYLDFPNWQWINDLTSFTRLAQEHLDCRKNTEVDIDIDWIFDGNVPAWDFLSFGYSLNVAINGASWPYSSVDAPVRTIGLRFDYRGAPARFTASASTRRRAFSGDDLYIHPEFAQGSPLSNATQEASGNWQEYGAMLAEGMVNPMGGQTAGGLQGAMLGTEGYQAGMVGAQNGLQMPQDQFALQDTLDAAGPMGPAPPGRQRREKEKEAKKQPTVSDFYEQQSQGRRGDKQDIYHEMAERALDKQIQAGRERAAIQERNEAKRQARAQEGGRPLPEKVDPAQRFADAQKHAAEVQARGREAREAAEQGRLQRQQEREARQDQDEKRKREQQDQAKDALGGIGPRGPMPAAQEGSGPAIEP